MVGNHGQLFHDSGLKSQFADVLEVAVRFLIVAEVFGGDSCDLFPEIQSWCR